MKRLIGIVVAICLLSAIFIWIEKNTLRSITLTSPRNTAMYNKVDVSIAKPAPVYIEYTEKKDREVLSDPNFSGGYASSFGFVTFEG
ncbi:MAG: hypothetical protein ACLR80_10515 [Parabacteroides merdae]